MPEQCDRSAESVHELYAEAAAVKFPEPAAATHASQGLPEGGLGFSATGGLLSVVVLACVAVVVVVV